MAGPVKLGALALLIMLPGCPTGRDRPDEPRMISIKAGTYTLGADQLQCADPNKATKAYEYCDLGSGSDKLLWIDRLSFAPRVKATVEAFSIDQHEVTNLHYLACVEDEACTEPAFTDIGNKDYYGEAAYEDHPVVWITRAQAEAYCPYVGKRLPNEAEWEIAARSGGGKRFPWGEDFVGCGLAPFDSSEAKCPKLPRSKDQWGGSRGDTTGTDSNQIHHLGSNVAEWVSGRWNKYAYCKDTTSGYDDACKLQGEQCSECMADSTNCALSCDKVLAICSAGTLDPGSTKGSGDIVRGGSFARTQCDQRVFARRMGYKDSAAKDVGFRCVK
jgi:formylglycine-generating enzyme required for sulfatase activity